MLNSISFLSNTPETYAVQQAAAAPKIPAILKNASQATAVRDVYQRADGSEVAANGTVKNEVKRPMLDLTSERQPKEEKPLTDDEQLFKDVLHQFVGQTLFGQMLKAMRATQQKNPYFDGGRAEEIFQGQLDMILTDQMTKSASGSLSDPMYKLMAASIAK
ncbi:MAG: rod-binding protein [Planctomycetaceae bacterium]|nr:rod-binding protein [Planctomycetaceae bacterium]